MFKLGARKLHSPKYKKFFFSGGRNIRNFVRVFFFYFLSLELEIVPVIPIILCLLKSEVFFNNQIWDEKFHLDKTDNLDSFQAHTSKKMSCKHLTPLKTQCSENTVGNMFKNAMNSN